MPRGVNTDGVAETEQPELSAPFDAEIGLVYTAVTPDGVTAELTVTPKLRQPMGIVHGGVWCSVVESLASVSAYTWLSANGAGRDGGGRTIARGQVRLQNLELV